MAIRYILGRAGKGKSHLVYQEIETALRSDKEQALILLVPEQYTLQAERDVISQLRLPYYAPGGFKFYSPGSEYL